MNKKILALSVGRSDYDRYFPILDSLNNSKKVKLHLYLTKAHQELKFGKTENFVSKKFSIIKKRFKNKDFKDNNSLNFFQDLNFLTRKIKIIKPNLIIVLGDRYEMLLGPLVAIPKNIPIIHIFGGAVTEGAIDELVRHAITKMSHFHLVVLDDYKRRLLQMGEEKWRIKTIGLHELNFKKRIKPFSKKFLTNKFKFDFSKPYCLLTFHPVTLELDKLKFQFINLVKALKKININIVITYPNADPQHEKIIYLFKKYCSSKKNYLIVKNLGTKNFVSVIRNCQFMIGNSSSGIVEAGTFKKPAINIGSRQKGKFKPVNVIDTNYSTSSILKSIKKANTLKFKNKIKNMKNPYESRVSVKKVSDLIIKLKANDKLLRKKFVDL